MSCEVFSTCRRRNFSVMIVLDQEVCAGHGQCGAATPEVFALDDDRYVVQPIEIPDEKYRAADEDALRRCPEVVIKLIDRSSSSSLRDSPRDANLISLVVVAKYLIIHSSY